MRRIFRRSVLWLLPVVFIPLGALLWMQIRFLRALEVKTVSAERNWLRNTLESTAQEIETRYRSAASAALTVSERSLLDVANIGKHFAAHPVPGARLFFSIRFLDTMQSAGFFDARGRERHPTDAEAEAIKMATVSWHVAHRWNRVAEPQLHVDERDPQHRIILEPVVDDSMHVVDVTGVILDERLAKQALTAIGERALRQRGKNKVLHVRVSDRFPRPIGERDYITQPLGFVFTNWRVGVQGQCATPEEVARTNFRHNAMWTGGAFIVLLGAIALALGAVARQARLSQMKSDFVSNVSHELRTPLSSIRVFGEYMRLGRVQKPEKIREYGEYIEAESRRLTQLINNILDFSKIESSEKQYRFGETDLGDLVAQTVNAFELPLRDSGVSIGLEAAAAPVLLLDRDAIGQVLMNLLDNAVKYSNGNKRIEVRVTAHGEEVRIAIRDHGIGIAAADQKKIFEKFYRAGSTLVHDVKGSGLGLSIVQHVVHAHGGRVELESAPGEGSTFTLVLPIPGQKPAVPVRTGEMPSEAV